MNFSANSKGFSVIQIDLAQLATCRGKQSSMCATVGFTICPGWLANCGLQVEKIYQARSPWEESGYEFQVYM